MKVKGRKVRTQAEQQRLYHRFYTLMNVTDAEEYSWRMEGMIHWWLFQMMEACDGDARMVMQVLVEALNHVGIQTAAVGAKVEGDETVQ